MAVTRLRFAHLPTPVEELPRLGQALGGPRLLIKRDDQTGLAFGGNKTRKLEFLVAEARDQGVKSLITGGRCNPIIVVRPQRPRLDLDLNVSSS